MVSCSEVGKCILHKDHNSSLCIYYFNVWLNYLSFIIYFMSVSHSRTLILYLALNLANPHFPAMCLFAK